MKKKKNPHRQNKQSKDFVSRDRIVIPERANKGSELLIALAQ